MPVQALARVTECKMLTAAACRLTLESEVLASSAAPGQFVHVRCSEREQLRRPISVCDAADGVLTLVVENRGAGTRWLTERKAGDTLDLLGPLGNGFKTDGKNILLVGGGIGVPPLLFTARRAAGRTAAILGFRNRDAVILYEEFKALCAGTVITTDDGSAGEQGPVTLPLKRFLDGGTYDGVLACGPKPMLKAVASLAREYGVACQVSMEERMGCGVGACLVCACKTKTGGRETMSRVCRDGPVFNAEEVVWE